MCIRDSNVSYLMKEEKFKVKQLVEFYPRDRSLLGMNVNRGWKIMLRLRDPLDEYRFLPMESVMGTMLHELTHNLHGPHNNKFYEKLDQLMGRQWSIEQMGLYDSFIGLGNKLGSKPKGGSLVGTGRGRGRKLGTSAGTRERQRRSAREMAAIAAEKRFQDSKSCGNFHDEVSLVPDQKDLVIEIIDEEDGDIERGAGMPSHSRIRSLRSENDRRAISSRSIDSDTKNHAASPEHSPDTSSVEVIDLT